MKKVYRYMILPYILPSKDITLTEAPRLSTSATEVDATRCRYALSGIWHRQSTFEIYTPPRHTTLCAEYVFAHRNDREEFL